MLAHILGPTVPVDRFVGYGSLLLVACSLAWFAPGRDRSDARGCVALIASIWLVYVTSWGPYRLHHVIGIQAGELWAVLDVMAATFIMGLYSLNPSVWRLGLVVSFLVQCGVHVVNRNGAIGNFAIYRHILDALWFGQLLCVVSAGRGGYDTDWLSDSWHRGVRDHSGPRGAIRTGSTR